MPTTPRDRAPAIVISPRYTQQLDQARVDGFLSYKTGQSRAFDLWYQLCKANRQPMVVIQLRGKYASVRVDLMSTPTRDGDFTDLARAAMDAILAEHTQRGRVWAFTTAAGSNGIAIADAPHVAQRLVALAQYREVWQ